MAVARGAGMLRMRQPPAALPEWAQLLNECCEEAGAPSLANTDRSFGGLLAAESTPFQELLLPFLRVARRRLFNLCCEECGRLSMAAHDSLLRPLLARLGDVAWRTFEIEFALHRASAGLSPAANSYQAFVEQMLGGGLLEVFGRYPVLGRLMGTLVRLWIESSDEFLRRLDADWAAIQSLLGSAPPTACVRDLRANCSDPHHGGCTVAVLEFEPDGRRVVYKPKDLHAEYAFGRLVDWINAFSEMLPLRTPRVVLRDDYGWAEFIASEPCADADQTRRYHARAGMLLALVHALGGVDMHSENLIASGEHPVLVDLETIMAPSATVAEKDATGEQLSQSILRTGLLPFWRFGPDGRLHNQSGLARDWHGHLLNEHVEGVVVGFKAMHCFLAEHREDLLQANGPLRDFEAALLRVIVRPTQAYAGLIEKLNHPRWLGSDTERGIELDVLKRSQAGEGDPLHNPRIVDAEIRALEQLDVPTITVRAAECDNLFTESGFSAARRRIAGLDQADCNRQAAILRSAFQGRTALPSSQLDRPLQNEQLIAIAVAIADGLRDRALHDSAGRPFWIGLRYTERLEHYRFEPLDFNLYNGTAGVALFLAAVEKVTGRGYGNLAVGAMQPLRELIGRNAAGQPATLGPACGGIGGWSSAVYAFVRISQFIGKPALLDDAEQLAGRLTPGAIDGIDRDDILSGLSGTILSLLALRDARPDPRRLQTLHHCGRRLAEHAQQVFAAEPQGQEPSRQPLTGFSHGAAGIAYALCRLASATGEPQYRDAALHALAYEHRHFDTVQGGWADFRTKRHELRAEADLPRQASWCHGAPGIALGRLGSLESCSSLVVLEELDFALQATAAADPPPVDNLCCGALGQVDVLLEAARRLDRPELRMAAERRAANVVRAADDAGAFALFNVLPRWASNPGLFQGIAGIGYELLRLAAPDELPSVLLLA